MTAIREIAQRAAGLVGEATPGPWAMDETRHHAKNQGCASASVERMDNGKTVATCLITAWKQGSKDARPDARFIAAARTDLPALAAFVLRATGPEMRGLLDAIGSAIQEAKHHHAGRGEPLDGIGRLPKSLADKLAEVERASEAWAALLTEGTP